MYVSTIHQLGELKKCMCGIQGSNAVNSIEIVSGRSASHLTPPPGVGQQQLSA